MGKVGLFTITYANASEIFYPGQNIQGEVQLQVKEEVKIREIRLTLGGLAHVQWTEDHGYHTVTYTSGENYFEEVILCQTPPNGEKNMMLQPGSYRYPFQFQLPLDIPSSFEGHFGSVRYYAKATMDRPWAFDEKVTSYYTVLNLLDLNALPDAKEPGNADGSKTLCCLCCKSGPISGRHRLDRIGYVPGEAIPIMAECINHSSRDVKMTSMELVQVISYINPRKTYQISTVIQQTLGDRVPKGDSDVWSGTHLVIPPVPSSGLVGCDIIDIEYYWQYVCEPSGPAFNLRIPLKIIIGGIPLVSSAQQHGATNPMNYGTSGSMPPPPDTTFPENIPSPSFASFSTNQNSGKEGKGNAVQPSDEMQMSNFQPQYPYYNWNQYDNNFKPTSY